MSLTIRIRSLYQENSISLSKSILSNANDKSLIQNLNLIPASKYSLIECRLKIYFISSNGKRINLTKQNVNEPSDTNRIVFKIDNKPIRFGDRLEILCFKPNKLAVNPFAKYTMLLDFLLSKKDDLCAQSKIHIDDYLIEPSTNKALKKKISFDLGYETSENIRPHQDLDSEIYSFQNNSCNLINHPLNQSTASDYIRSILKTGEFALNKFNLTENDFSYSNKLAIYVSDLTDESVRSWLQDINHCPSSLNLALNLIMSYELNNEQKNRFKKAVIRNNLSHSPNETMYSNEIYLPNLLSQIFYTEWTEKIYSWQIRVRIIELKLMHGLEETVYCIVKIGDQKFRTNDKSISNLHYTDDDETFIARIECKQYQKAFNYKISVSVYFKKFLYSDQFVGKFEVDFGTIYRLPGHEAHHKWGELFYINDKADSTDEGIFNSETVSRGFVKFDVILQSKGDKAKIHYDEYKSDDNDEIENNILVPYGLCGNTQMLKLVINIYSAQILNQKDMTIFEQVKSFFGYKQNHQVSNEVEQVSILLSDEDQKSELNPFIRVSFAGLTKTSPCLKQTKSPEWNHSIEFIFRFPSLVRLIKIELCTEENSVVRVLAKEYLVISDISNYHNDLNYLPTYGPSYIDFYNEPNNMRIKKFNNSQSQEDFNPLVHEPCSNSYTPLEATGSHYIARLLLGIKSSLVTNTSTSIPDSPTYFKVPPVAEFVCYLILDECTMIDGRYLKGKINFRLCIGTNGHEGVGEINESEPIEPIQLDKAMPIYLSYERVKPCMCLRFRSEDMRYIMFKINYIEKKLCQLSDIYQQIKAILWTKTFDSNDLKRANNLYEQFLNTINRMKEFIKQDFLKKSFISEFNKFRIKQIRVEASNLGDVIKLLFRLTHKFRQSKSNENFKFYIDLIIRNTMIKIKKHLNEPFSYFPDVNLWFLFNGQKVGVCNLKCNDVVWSAEEDKRGCISAKKVYTDVKSLRAADFDDPERQNLARIRIFAWMGTSDQVESVLSEKISLASYEFSGNELNELGLPKNVYYPERHEFQLIAYLYQGRDMLLLDIAGESDPFARISVYNQSVYSKTIDNTVNPTWNQELVISQVFLYGNFEEILNKPPELVVDIYDEDPLNQKEFMGRFYVNPVINTANVNPPKLKWYKLFHSHSTAGDILASFELIHLADDKMRPSAARAMINFNLIESVSYTLGFWIKKEQEIPKSITPRTRPYVFEIFYWGLRNIQDTNYITFGQQKICVQIQIGDEVLDPNIIEKCTTNSNFSLTHRRYEIQLPEEDEYKPHLNIRCECYGSFFFYTSMHKELQTVEKQFSRKILIGSCTIKSIGNYCYSNDQLKEFCRTKDLNRNFIHSISLDDSLRRENLMLRRFKKNIRKKKVVNYDADLDLDYLDWWSKYFTSIASENEHKKSSSDKEDTAEEMADLEMTVPRKKRRERRGSFVSLKQKISMQNEIKRKSTDKSQIQRIQVFDCELEKKFILNETIDRFSLIIGKNRPAVQQDGIQCLFKGKFMLYDEKNLSEDVAQYLSMNGGFLKRMPPNLPVKLKVHLYIVKVSIVNPIHLIGKFEPFICIQNGDNQIEEKFKNDSIEPLIGKSFELEANLPDQSQLTISIKNWNFLEGTELIGETTIDLEDRLYSKCYATCGLPKKFNLSGYNAWRDCHLPKDLLFKMCRKYSLLKPSFTNNKLIVYDPKDHPVFFPSDPDVQVPDMSQESDSDDDDNEEFKIIKINKYEQQLALDALNSWKKITKVDLIPEHVETRSLYNPEAGPELEQGKIQMWIDMFPMGNYKTNNVPKPVDITLRKPKKFQLRVVIKRTRNVILDDTNPITGEKKSDIYINGFLCDQEKVYQSTDVHYNSFNGSGEFNWRFVFDFEYLPAEKKIVFSQRQKFGLSVIEGKSRPIVNLHCYDADNFSSDDLLGTLELDLSKFSQGAGSAEICSLKMKNDPKWPKINLFKRKFYKGWWPFEAIDGTLAGKLEAEFQILSEKEAEANPAGRGREPPQPLESPE